MLVAELTSGTETWLTKVKKWVEGIKVKFCIVSFLLLVLVILETIVNVLSDKMQQLPNSGDGTIRRACECRI